MTDTTTRVAVLVGSLRADSLNRKLAEILRDEAPAGVTLDIIDGLGEVPFYNEDIDGASAPAAATALRERVAAADRVLAVTPEYNGTMPAVLNNAIDWISRPYGAGAVVGKPFGVIGATPTPYGREIQSIALLSTAGMVPLYSGVTASTRSAPATLSRRAAAAAGTFAPSRSSL